MATVQKAIPEVAILKAGDYIKYDTGVTTVGDNGVVTFRVLYPMDSEYGLQIISDKNVGVDIPLGGSTWEEGKAVYNSAIVTLNDEAKKYVNLNYAYDGRCVGSIPTVKNGMFVNKNKVRDSEGIIRDKLNTVSILEEWTMPTGWTSRDTGCYDTDTNYTIDEKALKEANILNTGQYYWLASHLVTWGSTVVNFTIRDVRTTGNVYNYYMCYVGSGGVSSGASNMGGIRPCISLKTDVIKITGGDGKSEETPYTIGT